jgi:uncharacterized membrane protein YdbT with pleckstrin-like domain
MTKPLDSLANNETITLQAETSRIAYLTSLLNFAVLMSPFKLMRLARTELTLTNQRIIGSTGAGGRKNIALHYKNIESVSVRRGMLGWLFDYGSVFVTDTSGNRTEFRGISWPFAIQQEAEEAIEKAVLGYKLSDYGM